MRNTDLELLERFHAIIGVGTVYGPYSRQPQDGFRRKPVWDGVAREEDGLDALALIWSWLSARRRKLTPPRALISRALSTLLDS